MRTEPRLHVAVDVLRRGDQRISEACAVQRHEAVRSTEEPTPDLWHTPSEGTVLGAHRRLIRPVLRRSDVDDADPVGTERTLLLEGIRKKLLANELVDRLSAKGLERQ